MRRRSGMTERGCSEEFNTRTGMNGFPFLSVRADNHNRQRGRSMRQAVGQAGETPGPSASTAACDDDQLDAYSSGLHVQASTALRYVASLLPTLYSSRYK